MKTSSSWILAGLLFLCPGCIYVHVTGDLSEALWEDSDNEFGFEELNEAVGSSLANPEYDLSVNANLWRTDAEWRIRYASEGSDGSTAFLRAKDAVLGRIEREGGEITEEIDKGPQSWACSFDIDGEAAEASVCLVEFAEADGDRPHRLEVRWREPN